MLLHENLFLIDIDYEQTVDHHFPSLSSEKMNFTKITKIECFTKKRRKWTVKVVVVQWPTFAYSSLGRLDQCQPFWRCFLLFVRGSGLSRTTSQNQPHQQNLFVLDRLLSTLLRRLFLDFWCQFFSFLKTRTSKKNPNNTFINVAQFCLDQSIECCSRDWPMVEFVE